MLDNWWLIMRLFHSTARREPAMARIAKETTPPIIDLKACLDLIGLIFDRGAGSMSYDDFARVMESTVKSSAFRRKLLALKLFKLIQSDGETVRLTQLAHAIVSPSSEQERQDAKFSAFTSVPILGGLYNRFKGGFLPEDTFLGNTISREFEVDQDDKDDWVNCFKGSGRVAGMLNDEGGKVRVLQSPKVSMILPTPPPITPFSPLFPANEHNPLPPQSLTKPEGTFPVLLDENRTVIIPVEFNRDDLEYLNGMLE